ncbi:MAG: 2-hydroxyacyl-CoA dehydratase family protein, partial [Dehalococcoidia bacterium]|nr:2-hydroxyacyl-CoA dehydratase family protein [Dehalococcoidia bacterium]
MRFWEEEIKKYERRIETIAQNPSSTKLNSNKLLYEIWRDHRRESLAAWDAGEPFVYGRGVAFRILKAMRLHEVSVGFEGDRAGKRAKEYLGAARNLGYPDHGCDRIMAGLGIVLSGDLPKPSLTITSNYPCDPENQASVIASHVFGVPSIGVDIPAQSDDKAMKYVVAQLEDMIRQIEHYLPNARYSEARLIEYQGLWRRQHKAMKDIYRLKSAVPCPVAGSDSFRLPPFGIVDDPRVAQYAEMYRDELAKRVSKGFGAVQGERLRFAWLISGPVYVDPWTFLAKHGVSVPFFEFGLAAY